MDRASSSVLILNKKQNKIPIWGYNQITTIKMGRKGAPLGEGDLLGCTDKKSSTVSITVRVLLAEVNTIINPSLMDTVALSLSFY